MLTPLPTEVFLQRTGICIRDLEHAWGSARLVVSLRELDSIQAVQLMSRAYRNKLLGSVLLAGDKCSRVYEGCKFETAEVSPRVAKIGQRFVQRGKYQALLEAFNVALRAYGVDAGVARMGAFIAVGKLKDGTQAVAQYLPPIMEMNGGSKWALLDGIHRNFIVDAAGGTISVITVEGVREPFPCQLHSWEEIRVVEEKPSKEERYFGLNERLFRNLEGVGIDG